MKLAVITPVGPGHERIVESAIASVRVAFRNNRTFSGVRHIIIDDDRGDLGRSKARNIGMDRSDADWFFFLDADDTMRPDALNVALKSPAVFGAVSLRSGPTKNVYPCGWREVALHGACGTLSMGFFCRADVARRLRFNEGMNAGEDFDFYLRLDDFAKLARPLVDIGYDIPSAVGPRGYHWIDWSGICNGLIADAVAKEPEKYDLGGDAILAAAGSPITQLVELPRPLPG